MIAQVTRHAARRFEERVRPGMTFADAGRELARLLCEFGQEIETPAWLEGYPLDDDCFWAGICDGVACIVQRDGGEELVCVTVLARASIGDAYRAARQERRRRHQGGRKVKRRAHERTMPELRRRPRARDWAPE